MVTHAYPRRAGDVAGTFVARLAEALAGRGHGVAVVAPADRGEARRFTLNGVEVTQVRYAAPAREDLAYSGLMTEKARSPAGVVAFLRLVGALGAAARAEAARLDAELVHAHWWIPAGWAATRAGLPTVVTLHGTDVRLLRSLPGRLLGRRVLGRARGVTAVSGYLAAEAGRLTGPRAPQIEVTPFPVDTPASGRASSGGGGIVVLGRLTAQKRVDLVLRAAKEARIAAPLTIIGDGPARAELERLAEELGLAAVRFVGAVPPTEVPRALGDADVLAFPVEREGLGLAAAEALMCGIPVVTTDDAGGVLDLVADGDAGRVVRPTPGALGEALRALLNSPNARAAARRAGEALRARLAPQAVAARFEQVYARCA